MKGIIIGGNKLVERLYWFIRLRWIAAAGIALTTYFSHNILNIGIQTLPLYGLALFLGVYNALFLIYLGFLRKRTLLRTLAASNAIANVQISLDLLSLTVLMHFSGGVENPFIFYFIFHMIIASILLTRRASFLQATFAVILFSLLAFLEYNRILPHYCLKGFIPFTLHNNLLYILGVSFVFASTLYTAVYMATSISKRLREREKNLQEAIELLNTKDRIKSEYVLRVTHDIKEHLAAIQSCIEPVTGGIVGQLNENQMNLLRRADERAGKLSFFIKALLEITRIKLSREIKMEYFSFKNVLSNAIDHITMKARDKNISITSAVEPGIDRVRGAREYIQETISNLLANSIKYTPGNGKVDVSVSDKGNSILIQIKDTGIGIPEDAISKVFDEFYRAPNAKKAERNGTGLGLSIARQIIKRHNGKIWVESKEGEGSTFKITLPK